MQLQWEPPTIPFGIIRGYTVYYTPSPPPPAVSDWLSTTTPGTEILLQDLEADTLYNFRVTAFNSVGDGPGSSTVSALTPLPIAGKSKIVILPGHIFVWLFSDSEKKDTNLFTSLIHVIDEVLS